ncbi:unnamed protein product [Arabis nemorensis]|uniref:DUF4378 domain-containing protein n=1 Tax=Arabis nemorensis TaxID=586526 RepID=A0A565CE73_9BRAS|nr:unnamed protein product [Arabis nemorensis]
MASISKRRLKPLLLRDYLLDDLSSCSSNGFKSFPRRQNSSTVHLLLKAEIKRSVTFNYNRRLTCGLAITHAVQKASTALLNAVKLLPFPSSVKPFYGKTENKKRLFARSFWKKLLRREGNGETRRKVEDCEEEKEEIQRWRSFGDLLQESQEDSYISPTDSFSGETMFSNAAGESSSFSSELFTNSEVTQSSRNRVVMMSGDCVGSHVSDGSSVNDNKEECVNDEKEQLSPISVLECPFEVDSITPHSFQKETDEKKVMTKRLRFKSSIQLEPVDVEKRTEQYVERQDYNSYMIETEENQYENRAYRLFALVKSRLIEEPNHLLESHKVDNVVIDFFKEDGNNETIDEDKLVKIVEEWVMRRQEEDCMFMSWEVREKREMYVKEMKWGYINEDEKEYVIEELGNCFVTSLIDELILDLLF